MDRRAAFFLVAAVMCFALAPIADTPHRPIAAVSYTHLTLPTILRV